MAKYLCGVCGYIYNEEKEGVNWVDLPDNWVCPQCKTTKDDFTEIEE